MFHAPKKGAEFKKIIDDWVIENADAFDNLKQKLAEIHLNQAESIIQEPDDDDDESDNKFDGIDLESFVNQLPKHEQFFMEQVLLRNPIYATIKAGIEDLCQNLKELAEDTKNTEHINLIKSSTNEENVQYIRSRIKKVDLTVHPHFENWLNEEKDNEVVFNLTLLMSLKMYNRTRHYTRYRLLWERQLWDVWRKKI